jgi:hypothetical protein
VIWAPPNTNPSLYYRLGDRASFPEYHWHGAQLLIGNAFVFGGLLLLAILAMLTVRARSTPAAGQAAGPQPLHAPM